jgi:hypothetical protein
MFVGVLEPVALQDHNKKILGEILGLLCRMTAPAHEQEDWAPVRPAKLRERLTRLLLVAAGVCSGQNKAPPGGCKHARFGRAGRARLNVHKEQIAIFFVLLQA